MVSKTSFYILYIQKMEEPRTIDELNEQDAKLNRQYIEDLKEDEDVELYELKQKLKSWRFREMLYKILNLEKE